MKRIFIMKTTIVFILVAILQFAKLYHAQEEKYQSSVFVFSPGENAQTWDEAKIKCENDEGRLAVINSERDLNTIIDTGGSAMRNSSFFIGEKANNGKVKWVNGESVNKSLTPYTQPSFFVRACGALYFTDISILIKFSDCSSSKKRYICEFTKESASKKEVQKNIKQEATMIRLKRANETANTSTAEITSNTVETIATTPETTTSSELTTSKNNTTVASTTSTRNATFSLSLSTKSNDTLSYFENLLKKLKEFFKEENRKYIILTGAILGGLLIVTFSLGCWKIHNKGVNKSKNEENIPIISKSKHRSKKRVYETDSLDAFASDKNYSQE